jgi:L-threonylcarbamoyladenylate synthase
MKPLSDGDIADAVKALQRGDVIAYPTEAVYGLGCDPFSHEAITKILQLKHRHLDQGFILVAASWDQIEPLIEPISPRQLQVILDSWPGPTTWTFPAKPGVPHWISGQHNSIAVRISDHPIVKALCESFGGPIVSTSANCHGQPPIRDYGTVCMTFAQQLAVIIDGDVGHYTRPSTIKNAITGEIIRP